jgi:RHS repeat-associated protein
MKTIFQPLKASTHGSKFLVALAVTASLTIRITSGQVGNDNPTGFAGQFNGNITTGCSYDPYTGNATRAVTDIVVAGTVGEYPLAFSRVSNSRGEGSGAFGAGGSWTHSYEWRLIAPEMSRTFNFHPTSYPVSFPDGREEIFRHGSSDPYFRAALGVKDRFIPLNVTTKLAYLVLPDGGKVRFRATQYSETTVKSGGEDEPIDPPPPELASGFAAEPSELPPDQTGTQYYGYKYQAEAIIDPYGVETRLLYNSDGTVRCIVNAPDPNTSDLCGSGSRSIHLYYVPQGNYGEKVIDYIQASDGRTVQYYYDQETFNSNSFTCLRSVVYYPDPSVQTPSTAFYTYQGPNVNVNGEPLLSTADDPMYSGPMKQIRYTYATGQNADGTTAVEGQIWYEKNISGTPISNLGFTISGGRYEVRGSGGTRYFTFDTGRLFGSTDFIDPVRFSNQHYDPATGYVDYVTDRKLHTTTLTSNPLTGNVTSITYPQTPGDTLPNTPAGSVTMSYVASCTDDSNNCDATNPYYLYSSKDEGGNFTFYLRDGNKRVRRINYPDGGYEEFTYNDFGQILTHTLTSGGVETFHYDGRGLLDFSWPPATPSDETPWQNPTHYFYYTSGPQMDRLRQVVDPRNYSTTFEYNRRGQVIKVTHDQDRTYAQNGYNLDGTLAWTADENHPGADADVYQRTRYIYDDYKRVTSVTNPMNETTTLSYAPPNGTGSYAHTTGSVYRATSPLTKIATFDYDENFRRKMVRKGKESVDDDGGTWFGYDAVGNLTSVQDPRGKVTTFAYDERNRRMSATAPAPFDDQITKWEYDAGNRLSKETRPDLMYRRMEYDSLNRVIDMYGFSNEHTHYQRDFAGNVVQMTDPKLPNPAIYLFGYDEMNRKTSVTYPQDAMQTVRGESWHYDHAGNMDQHVNAAGQTKTLGYDTRNRLYSSSWTGGVGPTLGLGYDDASRLRIVVTYVGGTAETIVVFGYDDANRRIWEDQTVIGGPTHRIETPRDSDGYRASLSVAGLYAISYDYTKRGQLWHIKDGGGSQWFSYSYDVSGNMSKRQDLLGGVNDSTDVVDSSGVNQYDALNRPTMWEQTGRLDAWFARSHFKYNNLNRLTASWRDEQAGKGEWFGYNATGQLTGVSYNADEVSTGNPQNATRTVTYTTTPDTLNRSSTVDNGYGVSYTPNALNQYEDVSGADVSYDDNFNLGAIWGFGAAYDAENHLTSASSGEDGGEFIYDGLGRCLKRTINGEFAVIVYDGWKPILENDAWNGWSWNVYGPGADEILYRHDAIHGDLRYHLDRMGNVAFILDSDGDGIEKYTYDGFGKPTVTTWSGTHPRSYSWYGNRFMFQGREWLNELGIYDFRNRFYQPAFGRFLQKDPLGFGGGDANLFRYCGGDPINRRDPFGLQDDGQIPIRPLEPFANGAQSLPGVSNTDVPGSNLGGPGPGGPSGGPSGPAGSLGSGGGGGGVISGLFGPAIGANGSGGISGSRMIGGGGGGGGAPLNLATMLKTNFYSNYGSAFENALRDRAGYVLNIPPQTLANSPELILGYSDRQLMQKFGNFFPIGTNEPEQGPYGAIYIANEAFRDRNPTQPFRVYAHELANIVDWRIYQNSRSDLMLERHFGIRNDPHDNDSGNAVELALFGPDW